LFLFGEETVKLLIQVYRDHTCNKIRALVFEEAVHSLGSAMNLKYNVFQCPLWRVSINCFTALTSLGLPALPFSECLDLSLLTSLSLDLSLSQFLKKDRVGESDMKANQCHRRRSLRRDAGRVSLMLSEAFSFMIGLLFFFRPPFLVVSPKRKQINAATTLAKGRQGGGGIRQDHSQ